LQNGKLLLVKSTVFPHHIIHKYTWTSPNGKTHNETDPVSKDKKMAFKYS